MRKASGLILEDSNPNGHGAIAGMSLNIPVIIGAENATRILKSGAVVTLDAERGMVSCNSTRGDVRPRKERKQAVNVLVSACLMGFRCRYDGGVQPPVLFRRPCGSVTC